jgi:acyl dehydratase
MKWLKPVRAGTALTLRVTVIDKRESKSRPDMGLARLLCELVDETGTPLAQQTSTLLVGRRLPETTR